jgi:hypothetical protein
MDDRDDWVPPWGTTIKQQRDATVPRSHDRTILLLDMRLRMREPLRTRQRRMTRTDAGVGPHAANDTRVVSPDEVTSPPTLGQAELASCRQ